jgi:predicted ATPase/class 3 adenylate cyclase/Flp pilus assembly protein TadD
VTEALTFLFTDIEGSTRKAHELGDAWFDVLEAHHAVLRPVFAAHGGVEVSTAGDSFFVVFEDAAGAVAATIAMQRAIAAHDWAPHPPLRVRMGLHTGPARYRAHDNDYAGLTVHAASRVESAAAGAQVLITQATLDAASDAWPGDVDTIDLGYHRLKDLPAELRLYQLAADGLPREFPPVRGLDVARNNVPVPPSTFVGRTDDLARLHRLLDEDRLVTLVGPGGTGKTRVALRLAAERLTRHADGVWFVELAAAVDTPGVVNAVALALGVKEDSERDLLEAVVDFVEDKSVLLVADNCEHVLDAAAATLERLLAAGLGVRVLATSREPIEIEGERLFPLAPLDAEGEDGGDAVALLADRIALVQPDFALDSATRAAAITIARRLDGLPLALELAAASAHTLSIDEIAAQIDARFELLTRGKRTAAERQKTLWGAIDWSYGLLSTDEQQVFRGLGVFPAEFDFGVVEKVSGAAVDESLLSLQRKSLVVESPSTRLRCLESIRAYAREQLAAHSELDDLLERHARVFVELADDATDDWVDTIHEDIAQARRWAAEHDHALELSATRELQKFWMRKGRLREGRALSDETLERTAGTVTNDRPRIVSNTGQIALLQGDTGTARQRFLEAADLSNTLNGPEARSLVLGDLGNIALREGDYDTATALYEESLEAGRRTGKREHVATSLAHLAQIASQQGDLARAWNLGVEAIEEARSIELTEVEFGTGTLLGVIAMQRGQHDDARQTFTDALALARKFDLVQPMAYLLFCLASVALDAGRPLDAIEHLRAALPLGLDIGADADVVESLEGVVRTAVALDHSGVAPSLLATADAVRERIGFARDPASAALYEDLLTRLGPAEPLPLDDAVVAALGLLDELQPSSTDGSGQT